MPHHNPERDESVIRKMLEDMDKGVKGEFPHGKIALEDEGAAHFAIAVDLKMRAIRLQFAKPVLWIGLDLDCAKKLRQLLDEKIQELEN